MTPRLRWHPAVLVLLPLLGACTAPPEPPPSGIDQPSTVWRALGTWSGRGNVQTESFDVATGALRLTWEARQTPGADAARFRVLLHSAISGRPLQTIVDRSGAGSGTAYVEDEPRVSYLVIESTDVEWTASLHEAAVMPPGR